MWGMRYKRRIQENSSKKGYKRIPIRNIIAFIIIGATVVSSLSLMLRFKTEKRVEGASNTIADKLENLSEITSLKYNYTSVVGIREHLSLDNIKIPFTEKSFLLQYNGYIKFGTDLSQVEIESDSTLSKITLKINKCSILDSVVDVDNLMIYDEKWTIFNKLATQDIINEIVKDKKNKEEQLIKEGYVDESNAKVSIILKEMLYSMGFKEVNIKYKGDY
ncbi:MAG: DUF4230 domain-containing protein [Clostridium sp.]